MSDGSKGAFGAIAVIVAYVVGVGAVTSFKPVAPETKDARVFLIQYYADVTQSRTKVAWDEKLTEDFKQNAFIIKQLTYEDYKKFWGDYAKVDVAGTEVQSSGEVKANLTYFKKTGEKSRPEVTFFRLQCPSYTALFPWFGCSSPSMKIQDTRTT